MKREDALRAARIELGAAAAVKDRVRDAGWESLVEKFGQDLRYALRTLRHSSGFTAAAVLTLALGIGATTVMFSVVYSVLVNPFPYKDFDRTVVIRMQGITNVGGWRGRDFFTPEELLAFRNQNHVFEDIVGSQSWAVVYDAGGSARLFRGAWVTANALEFFGVPPLLGRSFTAGDANAGAPPGFVLNHPLGEAEIGGRSGRHGEKVRLDGGAAA